MIKNFLNPKGHQNPIDGSKVTAILLRGWILPIGAASAGEGLRLQRAQQACLYLILLAVDRVQVSDHTAANLLQFRSTVAGVCVIYGSLLINFRVVSINWIVVNIGVFQSGGAALPMKHEHNNRYNNQST